MHRNTIVRRSKCKVLQAFVSTYKDFAASTSIHGIKYTAQDDISFPEKVLWVVIVILGIVGSSFMVILFWQRYLSNPTRTSTYTNYAPNMAIPMPALTFCTINRISHKKINAFISKLEVPKNDLEDVQKALPQLMGFTHPKFQQFNQKELDVLQRILTYNDYTSVAKVMRKISTTCSEMLVRCKWRGKIIDCSEIFVESFTTDGLCCSINYKNGGIALKNHTSSFGPEMGLTVVLDPRLEEPRYSSFRSSGIKMIFHKSTDYPGIGATHKFVASGKASFMQISGTRIVCSEDVRLLPIEQRDCVLPGDLTLKYFSEYTNPNCLSECTAFQLMDYCDCTPYFYWFAERDKPICDVSKIPCLAEFSRVHYKNQSNCSCYSQCDDVFYDILSSSAKMAFGDHVTSTFLSGLNNTLSTILLTIFFSGDVQTILKRDTITSAIYLLSSFGGVFSLFLGCSFLSGAEILYHLTLRFWVNLKLPRKEKRPKKVQNVAQGLKIVNLGHLDNKYGQFLP